MIRQKWGGPDPRASDLFRKLDEDFGGTIRKLLKPDSNSKIEEDLAATKERLFPENPDRTKKEENRPQDAHPGVVSGEIPDTEEGPVDIPKKSSVIINKPEEK